MKEAAIGIIVILMLMLSLFPNGQANFVLTAPAVYIRSPHHASVEIYKNTTIIVDIAVTRFSDGPEIQKLTYSLDGHTFTDLAITKDSKKVTFGNKEGYIYYGKTVLDHVPEGNYNLVAQAMDENGKTYRNSVDFRIDLNYEPPIAVILSPLNQTYNNPQIHLIFTTNGQDIQNAYYLLDWNSKERVQITGNTTLQSAPEGSHTIYLSVDTEKGHATHITAFNINSTHPSNLFSFDNQLSIIVIILIAATTSIIIIALIHKRKNIASKQKFSLC